VTEPPTVFMLFVFSHGDENGVIYTDQKSIKDDFFTIYDVWDALSNNLFLEECLKINIFGVRFAKIKFTWTSK
jgi:hypothetical protein